MRGKNKFVREERGKIRNLGLGSKMTSRDK
jgi:hypothetical protein